MKYDGCTCRPQHKRAEKDGKGYKRCKYFWTAILEFGWPNFKYEVLEDGLTREQANERERYWIEHDDCVWPKGYNCTHGGQGGSYGVIDKRPSEWGEHISKSKKGKPGKKGKENPNYGKHLSEETKKKISEKTKGENNHFYGKHFSDEHKRNLAKSQPCKKVQQFTKDGQFVKEFSSLNEAARETGIALSQISKCCSGKPNFVTAGNSVWKYAS